MRGVIRFFSLDMKKVNCEDRSFVFEEVRTFSELLNIRLEVLNNIWV